MREADFNEFMAVDVKSASQAFPDFGDEHFLLVRDGDNPSGTVMICFRIMSIMCATRSVSRRPTVFADRC